MSDVEKLSTSDEKNEQQNNGLLDAFRKANDAQRIQILELLGRNDIDIVDNSTWDFVRLNNAMLESNWPKDRIVKAFFESKKPYSPCVLSSGFTLFVKELNWAPVDFIEAWHSANMNTRKRADVKRLIELCDNPSFIEHKTDVLETINRLGITDSD